MKKALFPTLVVLVALVAGCSATGSSDNTTSTSAGSAGLSDCTRDGQGFTGGATVPLQIFGSYGPGQSRVWDVKTKKPTGQPQQVQMATGMPNGVVTILWGANSGAGNDTLTVECTTGWALYDKNDTSRLWHAGIIFDEISGLGTNTYFCHQIEMDTSGSKVTMKMWETYWKYGENYTCPDTLTAALDQKIDWANPITYLELPSTGIGALPVPPDQWNGDGTQVGVNTG